MCACTFYMIYLLPASSHINNSFFLGNMIKNRASPVFVPRLHYAIFKLAQLNIIGNIREPQTFFGGDDEPIFPNRFNRCSAQRARYKINPACSACGVRALPKFGWCLIQFQANTAFVTSIHI